MPTFRRYRRPAPSGSIVVRIVDAGGKPFGFVREVQEADEDDTYPTEQKAMDDVWRLVENKLTDRPDTAVFVEMETGVEWQPDWGRLTD